MIDHLDTNFSPPETNERLPSDPAPLPLENESSASELTPVDAVNGATDTSRQAEAGRKGAHRVHQLIRQGKLYEQEHGLKRGRQRLRQLIEEGRRYEEEHGLAPRQAGKRGSRVSRKQVMRRFLDALLRMVRPSYRAQLTALVQALEAEAK